jgi:hypothetical protein
MTTSVKSSKKRLSYSDLSIEDVRKTFQLQISRTELFSEIIPLEPAAWLKQVLQEGFEISVISEKARSEFIIAPILLFIREVHQGKIGIYSGTRFDIEPSRGLRGVCDFILGKSPMLPTVQAPVFMMVEAKKNDIEEGLGQCAAEMLAAQIFNQRENNSVPAIYGCVTTGENWQFLRLIDTQLIIDKNRYFLVSLPLILGILNSIAKEILQIPK